MINTEYLVINGALFVRAYSTNGFKLRKVGTNEIYDEAIDIEGAGFVYEETSLKVDE